MCDAPRLRAPSTIEGDTARNAALTQEVIALQGGTEAVEKNARENLGLIKEGEVYYQFVEEPKAP